MTATTSLFLNAHDHRVIAVGEVICRVGDDGVHMDGMVSGAVELRRDRQSWRRSVQTTCSASGPSLTVGSGT